MSTDFVISQPSLIGGYLINIPSEPLRCFISDCGSLHHPTSQELFDKMYRNCVDSERQMCNAQFYLGSMGLVAKLTGGDPIEAEEQQSSDASSAQAAAPSPAIPIPTSTQPIQQHHLDTMSLLEENMLATRIALSQLADTTGEHRTPMSTNMALVKKMAERLTEAKRIAMARGLVRKMNDDVDVKGDKQVVGEVNRVDVARIEAERQEILGLMEVVKARHAALLES
eukprot:GILI01014461.1.p1 GENE.GILI01014461.1~~GILI01014461.1.p1  ORF type:complete len:226 (-),score=51.78 GILI01014461.1:44-721(-)